MAQGRTGRFWNGIAVVLLTAAIIGLLIATWMPAIYDARTSGDGGAATTQPGDG